MGGFAERLRRLSGRPGKVDSATPDATTERIVAGSLALTRATDDALGELAAKLRERASAGENLDALVEPWFALVGEVIWRELGMRPYAVQVIAGLALHRGQVAEMQTGEGKTLAAVAPTSLAALAGRGAHVLTFNDYLARRDAAWMGPAYARLGLSVGCVQEGMSGAERREAYGCDVTYLTAKEAGFDLLRDQLCLCPEEQVHRPFHFALVDEADSILIDEARIPLVIAGDVERPQVGLERLANLVRELEPGADYAIDEHGRNIFLTDPGVEQVEARLACGDLYSPRNSTLVAEVRNALHAEVLLHRDVDYLVRDGAVELVDELTGRVAEKRHWPDGLQAAVEAKEGLACSAEGMILGSISLQHFLGLYPRLCGMTGTAAAAAEELEELYGLAVAVVPPHRPIARVDHPDRLFPCRAAKHRALVAEIARVHGAGRPVLVGTASVQESEELATDLDRAGVPCRVLNAKNDEQEATVIAAAGKAGMVTISTNMAGRGTDIRLGGEGDSGPVLELGGLYVMGTNRHESRRIDDQLRGRAGRQGDPGSTRFFTSLEDPLLVRYGIRELLPKSLSWSESDGEIDHPLVHREVARAQRIVEGESFDIRRRLSDYSSLVESQRRLIGDWRQAVLEGREVPDLLERRAVERWREARALVGEEALRGIERRLTLLVIDRCWSEHLLELQRLQDELQLVTLDGRTPLVEFCRLAAEAFDALRDHIENDVLHLFERLRITREGVDWDAEGLRGPSATWTYTVSDNVFGGNALLTLAVRPSIGFMGVLVLWPVLLAWGLYQHWRKRKKTPAASSIQK